MTTVTIKIENNNLQKARTEVEALLVYIDELAKTYPTTFENVTEDVIEEKAKPTRKPRTKKVVVKDEVKEEASTETKEVPEVAKEEKTTEEASTTTLTLGDMTALAKEAVAGSDRDTVKKLIAGYGKGKLSSVDENKFDELATELKALV